ncbi:DUF6702 family protein [Formosa sp. PL04]|uniref:DUF6702 family protein n=1 Tax=Formosa sp. PL04 TaxID=3081755 RepID=UPI0029822367|nr:DUF6702 family protein [Formosa sp. PL04]MDW5290443.1 DUF6702 family protein [Formosa sp. PL04]
MKALNYYFLMFLVPLLAFTTVHKYYVSITEIHYVKEKQSVQIITRIFIDDIEKLMRQRFDESITLAGKNESEKADFYLEKYLKEKIQIKINGENVNIQFIGKEYDDDIAVCYIEIPNVDNISEFEIKNHVLYDVFEEQQNVVRLDINGKKKTFILIAENDKGLLKLD